MTVTLGNINAGELRVEFVKSLLDSRHSTPDSPAAISETLIHTWGPYLDDARNTVVGKFLQSCESEILLFVDSDIGWTPAQVRTLTALVDVETAPVVGGLYYSVFGRDGIGLAPVAYRWGTHPETHQPFFRQLEEPLDDWADLVKVDAIGTGFLAIHRDLLIHMGELFLGPQPWFSEDTFQNVHHGEDFSFCQRISEMGVPIYLAPKVKVNHHKVVAL